jgi:hypothetical protein
MAAKLWVFLILLTLSISLGIHSYVGYLRKKHRQLFYVYGFCLLSAGTALIVVKVIISSESLVFSIAATVMGMIGAFLILIGSRKEKALRSMHVI